MPYCDQSSNGIRIFYRRCGHGSTKVLLIIGLAGTHDSWGPQIKGLTGAVEPNDEEEAPTETVGGESNTLGEEVREGDGIEVCCFDNRGVGRSSVPTEKSDYTTTIMAEDALALLDHLGWKNAHVFGHSMGAMIACKLAAMAPDRICSLALLNVTGGGFECFPKIDLQMLSLAFRFLRAKTPEQRAMVDLETHYTKEYLDECQLNACWTHNMTSKELETIRSSGFLVTIIHGRDDIIAQLDHARRLAKKLQPVARMVELHGAHLVSHERPEEVNLALMELIKASKSKLEPEEWSHLAESESDEKRADKYESKRDTDLVT
ncbi:hydrolase, alpha beta fold family domain containing protein [Musa troglodytarum]|uniref:Hydrolase, alpha beta fold family domain containing protein n=1 Tax=Musa troglodytarum TaxID=320322 RepID=A0A9E7KBN0_9LILI|nr:hydrolase, alpha beta fold family domain containing protein [Musa troglodytarum]